MPRVRLQVWDHGPGLHFTDPRHPRRQRAAPSLRLTARLLLGPDPAGTRFDQRANVSAVIDTGSPFSVLQAGTWESYQRRGLLELLPLTPNAPGFTVAGSSVRFRLGRMWVGVLHADSIPADRRRRLPAVPVLFLLPARPIANLPHAILIGLHESILDGRWLIREPVNPVAGPETRYDIGPRYGQQWWLQDQAP